MINNFVDDLTIAVDDIEFDKKLIHHRTSDGKKIQMNKIGQVTKELDREKRSFRMLDIGCAILDNLKKQMIVNPTQIRILRTIRKLKSKTGFVSIKSINKNLTYLNISQLKTDCNYLAEKEYLLKNKGGNYKITDKGLTEAKRNSL